MIRWISLMLTKLKGSGRAVGSWSVRKIGNYDNTVLNWIQKDTYQQI